MLIPSAYPPVVADLLAARSVVPLGPGTPDHTVRGQLAALNDDVFGRVGDRDMAAACTSGLWIAFNFLDESHDISQNIHTPEGSFWHAIMHRREPDAWNSKYWWRRVGPHPVLDQLREYAPEVGYTFTTAEAFVDFCERTRGTGNSDEETAKRVQHLEWELLFAWCFERATGA